MYISSNGNDLCMNKMVAPTVPKTVRDLWQKKSPLSGGETDIQLLFRFFLEKLYLTAGMAEWGGGGGQHYDLIGPEMVKI